MFKLSDERTNKQKQNIQKEKQKEQKELL